MRREDFSSSPTQVRRGGGPLTPAPRGEEADEALVLPIFSGRLRDRIAPTAPLKAAADAHILDIKSSISRAVSVPPSLSSMAVPRRAISAARSVDQAPDQFFDQ